MTTILIQKDLTAENVLIGKGARINLRQASPPMIKFLRYKYEIDPQCLKGDLDFLYKFEGMKIDNEDKEYYGNYEQLLREIWNGKRRQRKIKQEKKQNK